MGEPISEVDKARIQVDFDSLVNMTAAEIREWAKSPFAGQNRLSGAAGTQAKESLFRVGYLTDLPAEEWTDSDIELAAEAVERIELALQGKPAKDPLIVDGSEGPTERDALLRDAGHDSARKDARMEAGSRKDGRGGWVWRTQKDGQVRESHAALEGKRFDVHARHDGEGLPGDAFGCRCYPEILPQRGTKREADAIERQTRNASARAKTRWTPERQDYAEGSITVMLPIPADIAAQFPPDEKRGAPHVTMVYCGPGTEAQLADVALVVADELHVRWSAIGQGKLPLDTSYLDIAGQNVRLAGLGYFENEARVAFARVSTPADIERFRGRVLARAQSLGIEVPNPDRPWVPHATLAYLAPATAFEGTVPDGEWPIDSIEVWRGDTRLIIRTNGKIDKLELVGSKWNASTDAGLKPVGTFESEAEAREGLRQAAVLRALSGRYDGKPKAPAVITEPRACFDAARVDRAELQAPEVLANGWHRYPVLYSKAGNVQGYMEGGRVVNEYRPFGVVFDRASMDSGVGIPWELRHSAELLSPDSVLGVARGTTLSVDVHSDGIHTCGHAMAWDRDLFESVDSGKTRDVSVASRVRVDPRPGTSDDGQRFDRSVTTILWNSLAAEPKGRAGTARVLSDRLDARSRVITSADAMLALAAGKVAPASPVYFDLREWARFDSAHQPEPKPHKDADPMNPISILIAASGMSEADIAAKLGIAEADLAKVISGESEFTTDLATKFLAALAPAEVEDGAGAPPPGAEMVKVTINGQDFEVPATVAADLAMQAEKAKIGSERADRAEIAKRALEAELQKHKDAAKEMIPRADADKMVLESGLEAASIIELARRANGNEWAPESRMDGDTAIPVSLRDWKIGAIRGAYRKDADSILEEIEGSPVRDALLDLRVKDARRIIDSMAHQDGAVRTEIRKNRDEKAQERADKAKGGDKIAAAKQAQAELAAGTKTVQGAT